MNSVILLSIICLFLACLGHVLIDGLSIPGVANDEGHARVRFVLGLSIAVWLWTLWLGLSARPAFATIATLSTSAVFVLISRMKYTYLREPLVFSDLGFLGLLIRHPALFYIGRKERGGLGIVTGVLLLFIGLWIHYEPRAISAGLQAMTLILAFLPVMLIVFGAGKEIRLAPRTVAEVEGHPAHRFVKRLGLSVSLLISYVVWRAGGSDHEAPPVDGTGYDAVIIVQSESFIDLRRQGVATQLPNLDRMRLRALAHGRLNVSCFGAYTHRSEVEMLTGVPFTAQGMDRFDPYLRPERIAQASLAMRLRIAGWQTRFIHPHDQRFFRRDRAISRLGFDQFIGEDAFAATDRYGPYIGDIALAMRIVKEIKTVHNTEPPLLLMAVSMEAHDPYGIGRLSEIDDPVKQYVRHIAHADTLLGLVVEALDTNTRHSLLVFYGDHAPILPGHEALAEDTATDFVLLSCGSESEKMSGEQTLLTLSPAEVHALLCSLLDSVSSAVRISPSSDEAIESIN